MDCRHNSTNEFKSTTYNVLGLIYLIFFFFDNFLIINQY